MTDKSDMRKLKAERRFLVRLLHFEQNEIVILGAETRLIRVMEEINQLEYNLELWKAEPIGTDFKTPRDNAEWHEIRSNLAQYGRQVLLDKQYGRVQIANAISDQADQAEQLRRMKR